MAEIEYDDFERTAARAAPGALETAINWTGALLSVALVLGMGVWGYRLVVRDVSGVPVVRALEGPMRVTPDDPGGRRAANQGLAVNRIAAEGNAAPPAERVVLAPQPVSLTADDVPRAELNPVPEVTSGPPTDPATDMAEDPIAAALAEAMGTEMPGASQGEATPSGPAGKLGVARSPLPRARPEGDMTAALETARDAAAIHGPVREIDPQTLPPGTNLVQLGAFESPELAREEWQRLAGLFGSFMDGRDRVVQAAVSGGRRFYRLRAAGFPDISSARRFCAALVAEGADCIPVVAR